MSNKQYDAVLNDPQNPKDDPFDSKPIQAPDDDAARAQARQWVDSLRGKILDRTLILIVKPQDSPKPILNDKVEFR